MREHARPLLVLHGNPTLGTHLERAVGERFDLVRLESWRELSLRTLESSPASVLLLDPAHGHDEPTALAPELEAFRERFPSSCVIAALATSRNHSATLTRLGHLGIAEIIDLEDDLTPAALRQRILSARAQPFHRLLRAPELVGLSGRGRAILDRAVDTVVTGGLPRDLADDLGLSPSTLLRWSESAQLPTPRRLVLWLRVILACALLDDPGHSVHSVGRACGYSGDHALRRAIRSVLPMSPSGLRERGAFETASSAFFKVLAEHRHPAPSGAA